MDGFDKKALIFFAMLCNAFKNEDDYESPGKVPMAETVVDLQENLIAMLGAIKVFCDQVCPKLTADKDLIDFAHLLAKLAMEYCSEKPARNEDDE